MVGTGSVLVQGRGAATLGDATLRSFAGRRWVLDTEWRRAPRADAPTCSLCPTAPPWCWCWGYRWAPSELTLTPTMYWHGDAR